MHVDQTNLIGNAEDFEGVEQEPHSHHDFQTHQVFADITQKQTNRSVLASPPRLTKKLTAT